MIRQFYNKNQFIMDDDKKIVFKSYNSIIAVIDKKTGELFFGNDWNYSNTTRKHLYLFLSDYKTARKPPKKSASKCAKRVFRAISLLIIIFHK